MGDDNKRSWLDTLKERLREWIEAVDEAFGPRPQRVPVPVRPSRPRA